MALDTTTSERQKVDPLRLKARKLAAQLLSLPQKAIEDDLVDFMVLETGNALLRARAGSGKTTAIGLKIAFQTRERGVDPSRVMALTFNNAAARGLETKLKEFGVSENVRVRTFHAYAQRIIRAYFGASRRPVFDEESPEGRELSRMMGDALDEVISDPFLISCASRMRTRYDKRPDYVEAIARDALVSAVNFLRTRGYGAFTPLENAWDIGPIAGNAMKVIRHYESEMREAGLLDATSVLLAAAWTLEKDVAKGFGRASDATDIDWIFVDEFQDMSLPYMRLIKATSDLNGFCHIHGVGDDWQAINGFAGADLTFFRNIDQHLSDVTRLDLLRNRRSGSQIVDWGNAVMARAGEGGGPAIASPANGDGLVKHGRAAFSRDLNFAISQVAEHIQSEHRTVALIARRWKVSTYTLGDIRKRVENVIRSKGKTCRLVAITAHGSKGLEYDQVLLLDDGSFPLMHPSRPILADLIDEEQYQREETCLYHVAGTRARQRLDIITCT